jgi:hypothetical protein
MLKIISITAAILLTSINSSLAEIYSWKDAAGNTIYSDQKPSVDAQPSTSGNPVNYYTADKPKPRPDSIPMVPTSSLATLSNEDDSSEQQQADRRNKEKACQDNYRSNCDKVENWKEYARQACGSDSRCNDPVYLDKKYRPRSNEELQAIARRAAIRNNLHEKKIADFLNKKYTNYCANQAAMVCQNNRSAKCDAQIRHYCEDPRGLADVFNQYDHLSTLEKQQIIAKAKQMAINNGGETADYEKLIGSLIEILISQALMGL